MPDAITAMLNAHGGLYDHQARREKKMIGTPGAPNRSLSGRSEHREEQGLAQQGLDLPKIHWIGM